MCHFVYLAATSCIAKRRPHEVKWSLTWKFARCEGLTSEVSAGDHVHWQHGDIIM